jgi:hypothetical protein
MRIVKLFYFPEIRNEPDAMNQLIMPFLGDCLIDLKEGYDAVYWIGTVTNEFLGEPEWHALVFIKGDYDSVEMVDTLIQDAYLQKWTPFYEIYQKTGLDRENFIKVLRGERLA